MLHSTLKFHLNQMGRYQLKKEEIGVCFRKSQKQEDNHLESHHLENSSCKIVTQTIGWI